MYVINTPEEIYAWDKATMEAKGIDSLALMEGAARAFTDLFEERYPLADHETIHILCGPGNNGGDGAAIARLLEQRGYTCSVFGYHIDAERRSEDLVANWQRLLSMETGRVHENLDYAPGMEPDVVIDALFGVGLSRPLEGAFAKTVRSINDLETSTVVAVDVPSGQRIDGTAPDWLCVDAHCTITFGSIKRSALFKETGLAWGSVQVVRDFLVDQPALESDDAVVIANLEDAKLSITARDRFTHKGDYGRILIIAGSKGHGGAALLATGAALRAGAGLVTVHAPNRLETLLQLGAPEAMFSADSHDDRITETPDLSSFDAVVFGPGVGQHADTLAAMREVLAKAADKVLVLDADGLNLLAANKELWEQLPKRTILTPHPGEFARLAQPSATGHVRFALARRFCEEQLRAGQVLVLKGQYTSVWSPEHLTEVNFFHGNPGMASGGMGDTLTGIIAAIAAVEDDLFYASRDAVLLHAAAGDIAAAELGQPSVLASDVADRLGRAARDA